MRIAVIQHQLRETAHDDAAALADAVASAVESGAQFIVAPEVLSIGGEGSAAREELYRRVDEACDRPPLLIPWAGAGNLGMSFVAPSVSGADEIGALGLLIGDACMTGSEWLNVLGQSPKWAIMCPRSESELQAEAVLETAIALSDALCGLIIVAECDGAEPGEIGHGGSAIVVLGEVVAEALGGDAVLIADVPVPVPQPEPREPFPELPTILKQRLAHHQGDKLDMGYLADLSDGGGES